MVRIMEMTEQQYERVAQWLDGQDVSLNDAERTFAEQIRGQEASVGAMMADIALPREAFDRASRRMTAALARPTGWRRVGRFVTAASAAAAIIAVAAMVMYQPGPSGDTIGPIPPGPEIVDNRQRTEERITEELLREMETRIEGMEESIRPGMMVEILASQFESIEVDSTLAVADADDMDIEINALEDEFADILLAPVDSWPLDDGV